MHEEMPRRGPSGAIYGFQLWVNLPAAEKMSPPRYQEVKEDQIPIIEKPGFKVRIVAGEFEGVRGPVTEIAAQPLYMDISIQPDSELEMPVTMGHSTIAYIFEGNGLFGINADDPGISIEAVRMAVFGEGDHLRIKTGSESWVRFMLMAGAPFNEAIVPYGPFVMNTEEEIRQAMMDLRNGTFVNNIV
jgi:hypothetical protein